MKLYSYVVQIFDLDDTLVDTRKTYQAAQLFAINEVLLSLLKKEDLKCNVKDIHWFSQKFGSGNPELYFSAFLKNIAPQLLLNNTSIIKELCNVYYNYFWKNLKITPHANQYLEQLYQNNKKIFLVSNGKLLHQIKKLKITKLLSYFESSNLFVSSEFPDNCKKPSSYMIEQILLQTQEKPENLIFYGNIVEDILAGNLAGINTVLLDRNKNIQLPTILIAQPNHILSSWEEAFHTT